MGTEIKRPLVKDYLGDDDIPNQKDLHLYEFIQSQEDYIKHLEQKAQDARMNLISLIGFTNDKIKHLENQLLNE